MTDCVLVVDDDPSIRKLVSIALQSEGLNVLAASDGKEALDLVDQTSPRVIILDVQMPVMSGPEFLEEARSRGIESPVVILSAYGAQEVGRRVGANAAIAKPFDPQHLVDTALSLCAKS